MDTVPEEREKKHIRNNSQTK